VAITSNSFGAREHLLQRDVRDGVLDAEQLLPLAAAVGLPQGERGLDLGAELGLHLGGAMS
jgi:hypothetical protein